MTKTAIQTLITAIGDGLANKAVKIRAAYSAVLDSNYSASILESSINPTSLTITSFAISSNAIKFLYQNGFLKYNLRFTKKGNLCFVKGFIELLPTAPYPIPNNNDDRVIFEITNNEYKVKDLGVNDGFYVNEKSYFAVLLITSLFVTNINIGEKIFIDSFYELEN